MNCVIRLVYFAVALMLGAPVALAQSPAPSGSTFATETTLTEQTIVFMSGTGTWESAFDTIVDAFKNVHAYLERVGVKPAGNPMIIYLSADDTGFQFQAALPIAEEIKNPPRGDLAMGKSPAGKAFKFVHRGSYDSMDNLYEAITNFLDEKGLEAKDMFIEEYETDPRTAPQDSLVINVYVPIK